MIGRRSLLVALVALGLGISGLLSPVVSVSEADWKHTDYTGNVGELTGALLVGQTFRAERDRLAGVGVLFATYSGRENTQPVIMRLHEGLGGKEIRRSTVEAAALGDNQLHQFRFAPLEASLGRSFFFSLTSPTSTVGNAVTVDVDRRDPYPHGSAFLVRGPEAVNPPAHVLASGGKQALDVAFATYYEVPLRVAVVHGGQRLAHAVAAQREAYVIWARAVGLASMVVVVLVTVALSPVGERRTGRWLMLALVVALGVLVRLAYARHLPLTSDEGSYLYDAWTLRQGILAGGDVYVKAPLVVAWIALWQMIVGDGVVAGRVASIVASVATVVPLYLLGREVAGWRGGLLSALSWAWLGAPVVGTVYAHTQPLALFFAVFGIALLWLALRGQVPRLPGQPRAVPAGAGWFVLAGVLLGLSIASRKSTLGVGLVPLVLIWLENRSHRARVQQLLWVGVGCALVVAALMALSWQLYGEQGVREVLGLNAAVDSLSAEPAQAEQVRAYSLRGMTPFFRESLPLVLLALLGLGWLMEQALTQGWSRYGKMPQAWLTRAGWLVPVAVWWWAQKFFFEYEGAPFMILGIPQVWYLMGAVLVAFAVWPKARDIAPAEEGPSLPRHTIAALGTVTLWVLGLVILYRLWIKFHANYLVEFLPPLAVAAGAAVAALKDRVGSWGTASWFSRLGVVVILGVAWWSAAVSGYVTFVYPHTGTYELGAVVRAAQWVHQHVAPGDTIFTGVAVVPYLADHHTALDIAHPRWYAYEAMRTDPQRLGAFLPPIDETVEAFRQASWFLNDQHTSFSFLMEHAAIEAGLAQDFEPVHAVENGGNELTFYQRVRPASR